MMPVQQSTQRTMPADAGLTLIELLVSLTLLAMLMLVIPSTLRLASRAGQTAAELVDGRNPADAMRFVERQLSEALPLFERGEGGALKLAFNGGPQSLTFVAPLAAGPAGGGLYRVELSAMNTGSGVPGSLVLRLTPVHQQTTAPAGAGLADERQLVRGLATAQFRYFGAPQRSSEGVWQTEWRRNDRLPELIEVSITRNGVLRGAKQQFRAELRLGNRG